MNTNQEENYFETIRCEDYEVQNIAYHNRRVANSIAINFNLGEYIYPPSAKLLKCKVTYNEETIKNVEFSSYKKREIKSFKLIFDDKILYNKKSTNRRAIDELFRKKESADEIIIVKNTLITDTSIANIAIFDGKNWLTPKTPLLKGSTRARLIDEEIIFEKNIDVDMLKNASKIALLNAMIGMDILDEFTFI